MFFRKAILLQAVGLFLVITGFFYWWFSSTTVVQAQAISGDVAITVSMAGPANNGDIICLEKSGYLPCTHAFDPNMVGVMTATSAAVLDNESATNRRFMVNQGQTEVRVSSVNGSIKRGDFITSSKVAGIGQRADRNGFIVGTALDSYDAKDPKQIGSIPVSISIHNVATLSDARENLLQTITQALSSPTITPLASLRYLLAFTISAMAFVMGFFYFGKATQTGIEAIGRNPLASRVIELTVVIHIVMTVVIILSGLVISYIILIL